jgi:hypothetical protein
MALTTEELDALLAFLEKAWLPPLVQQAYDRLAAERARRGTAEARLSDLEHRLREAAAQPRPPAPLEDLEDRVSGSQTGEREPATND